jgi:hypothetical protein
MLSCPRTAWAFFVIFFQLQRLKGTISTDPNLAQQGVNVNDLWIVACPWDRGLTKFQAFNFNHFRTQSLVFERVRRTPPTRAIEYEHIIKGRPFGVRFECVAQTSPERSTLL